MKGEGGGKMSLEKIELQYDVSVRIEITDRASISI